MCRDYICKGINDAVKNIWYGGHIYKTIKKQKHVALSEFIPL